MRMGASLRIAIVSAAVMAGCLPVFAQSDQYATLPQQVAQSMKRYARDISEIPIQVEATTSYYDKQGKLKKTKKTTHTMQFVKRYVKGGKVVRELTWKRPGLHWVSKDEANADSSTSLMALLFDNGVLDSSHTYNLTVHTVSKRVDVRIGHTKACEPFDPMNVHKRLWCGDANLELNLDTMMPLKASFDEGGLPHQFDSALFKSFHFDEEFQMVPIAGSSEPLLLPAKIVVSYETDRGKTTVESHYSIRP